MNRCWRNAGDTVNVPIPPIMVANNIAGRRARCRPQNPNLGNAQIVLNTHAEATFQIPDVTKVLAVPDLLKLYMQPAVVAIAQKIESDLLNLYAGFTANTRGGHAGDGAHGSDDRRGGDGAVPGEGAGQRTRSIIVVDAADLFGIAADPAVQRIPDGGRGRAAGADRRDGREDQRLLRVPFAVRAKDGKQPGDYAQPGVHARTRIGLVVRRLPQPLPGTGAIAEYAELGNFGMRVVMSYQPNTLAQQFTVDVLYGCGVLRNTSGVQVNT